MQASKLATEEPASFSLSDAECQAFYRSYAWKRTSKQIMKANHYECQACKAKGRYTRATMVHHEKSLKMHPLLGLRPHLADGTKQLVPLCRPCHEAEEEARGNRPQKASILSAEWW